MADTAYQQKFKAHLKSKGVSSVKDIPPDEKKDFFDKVDASHKSEKEKKGDYSESITRAQKLLSIHKGLDEAFYKTNKGKKHRNRKPNGMDNITPRD